MKKILLLAAALTVGTAWAAETEAGFTSLMDGKTFTGWKLATENTNTFRIAPNFRCRLAD